MITIGIDRGLSGAVVVILSSGEIEFHDIADSGSQEKTDSRLCRVSPYFASVQ